MRFWLTDAPADDIDAIIVTISRIDARFKLAGAPGVPKWVPVVEHPGTFNLLTLQNGLFASLGGLNLPEGEISEFRLVISAAEIVIDGVTSALSLPSADDSGVKLKGTLKLTPDAITDVVFDFDAAKSIVGNEAQGFKLKPVIRFGTTTTPVGVDRSLDLFQGPERALIRSQLPGLIEIKERHVEELFALPQVHAFGIGADEATRTLLFVVQIDPGSDSSAIPTSIEGVPVRVEASARDTLIHGGQGCEPCHHQTAPGGHLPVQMGYSTEDGVVCNSFGCTLGFQACDRTRNRLVYVGAQHCQFSVQLCAGRGDTNVSPEGGRPQFHPPRTNAPACPETNRIGRLSGLGVPGFPCGGTLDLDAAKIDTSTSQTTLVIGDIGIPSPTPGADLLGTDVVPGSVVQKSGNRTGHTRGKVTQVAVDQTGNVPAGDACCGTTAWKYKNHIRVETLPDPAGCEPCHTINGVPDCSNQFPPCVWAVQGDSGSPVLTLGGFPLILGIAVTSKAVSPVDVILDRLDLDLSVTNCGGGFTGCAVATAAAASGGSDPEAVPTLQKFRDDVMKKTSRGQHFVSLYESHSAAAVAIALTHPSLLLRTHDELDAVWPWVHERLVTGHANVSSTQVSRVDQLLRDYAKHGNSDFQKAIGEVCDHLRDAAFLSQLGITIQ